MIIHRIVPVSKVNGPGARFAIWVQGCSRNCVGCFNPLTHSLHGGYSMAVKTILEAVPFGDIQGVTVSGGEPFDQAEELEELLHGIRILNLHTLVYTGFTYEELVSSPVKAVRNTLNLIDMLIDGPYQIVNPPKMRWTGSGNQRIIELKNGQIIKNDEFVKDAFIAHENGEIHIANDGSIIATGIFNSEFLQQEG